MLSLVTEYEITLMHLKSEFNHTVYEIIYIALDTLLFSF